MVAFAGPLATISCELRQAWKGATVTVDSGAGVWLALAASIFSVLIIVLSILFGYSSLALSPHFSPGG